MWWCVGVVVGVFLGGYQGLVVGIAIILNGLAISSRKNSYVFIGHKRESEMFEESIAYSRATIVFITIIIWSIVWWLL
ncbi:MAG: hypothetical protein ACRCX7_10875 [Cetobacterium sp.]